MGFACSVTTPQVSFLRSAYNFPGRISRGKIARILAPAIPQLVQTAFVWDRARSNIRQNILNFFLPSAGAHRALGLFAEEPAERAHHFEAAANAYLEGLKVFPQDEHTVIRLAETMADLARFKDADAFFRAALVLDPKLGRIHAYYAKHLALVGREKDAEETLAKARSLAPYDDMTFILRGTYLHPDEQNK